MTLDLATLRCPLCGGGTFWDNRTDKRTPRSPDLKCRSCQAVCWLGDDGRSWTWKDAR